MKASELKWPNSDFLTARARTRIKELRRLIDWHTLNESEINIVQRELEILATMTNSRAKPEEE